MSLVLNDELDSDNKFSDTPVDLLRAFVDAELRDSADEINVTDNPIRLKLFRLSMRIASVLEVLKARPDAWVASAAPEAGSQA